MISWFLSITEIKFKRTYTIIDQEGFSSLCVGAGEQQLRDR